MARNNFEPTPEMKSLLIEVGSRDKGKSLAATQQLAKALELPLRKGIMSGNILDGIFEAVSLEADAAPEFPLDLLAPGTEKDHIAYTIPNHGRIPERHVESDYVMVPTYDVASAIDWLLKHARAARWDLVGRAMEVLNGSFTKKMNDDGWHTLLAAGVDRNILIYDDDAGNGQFTKRLVTLLKTAMRRNGGGNSASNNRFVLTDLYVSPEAKEDVRNWGVDELDEISRRELLVNEGGLVDRIFQVNMHDLDELGDDQEYQRYFEGDLSGSMPAGDAEIVVGLDLNKNTSFVMPVKEQVSLFADDTLHRQKRAGFYGWAEVGFASLDNRNILLGSF